MKPLLKKPPSVKMVSIPFLTALKPVHYGLVAIILATVAYSWFDILPMLRHDLQLLRTVYAVDVEGIRTEGELQLEIQESRRQFLGVLLVAAKPAEAKQSVDRMRAYDATIAATESSLGQLNLMQSGSLSQFHSHWLDYLALRDKLVAAALAGGQRGAQSVRADLGRGAFEAAEQSVQAAPLSLATSSANQLAEVSRSLNRTLKQVVVVIGIKILALCLLLWLDWRRILAEKRLKATSQELLASEDRFRHGYATASVGMGIVKLDGTLASINPMGARILGYEPSEIVGRNIREFIAPEHRDDHPNLLSHLSGDPEKNYRDERRILRKDGSTAWVRNSVTLLKPKGQEPHLFYITQEITEQKEASDRLTFLANFDPVTNLPNRHYFERQLALELKRMAGHADCIGLIYLEIDSFDFIKGTFSRKVADEVLAEVGAQLANFRRDGESVARLDDHVFAMLLKAAPYDEATMLRAGELRAIFHRTSESGKHRIPIAASIGIVFSNHSDETAKFSAALTTDTEVETLLKYARAAMLEARSRGGDSIYLADPALQERAAERHRIESALLRGIHQDEFRVVFQPQFQVASSQLVRFEALCRWNSAELGPIPPDRFIPIAEQTGLIMEIGRRILVESLKQAKIWTESGRRIGVAVNISPMQFMRPDFPSVVAEALAHSQYPPELLELEITEGIFIRDLNVAVARIRELQRLGLSIALDDFGTGYSSLSYLQRMPIDAVKLDRSFVSDLTTDPATVSMVRSVLAMAEALHLRVVTEGVETEQQLEILRELGCDEAQGYLLGRPESSELALRRVLENPMQPVGMVA